MGRQPLLLRNLRENLFALLENSYTELQLNELVALSHALASASLKHVIIDGTLKQHYLGLAQSDIAYDCIADLFRRDAQGNLLQLQTYFKSLPSKDLTDTELLGHLRRIVQSKTNQALIRIYQEMDPSLGKILRNIRISIQMVRNFQETERYHEAHITPVQCDPLDECTSMDTETLIREFGPMVIGSENTPDMLAKLAIFLRTQTVHRRSVSLVSVALAFRMLYAQGFQTEPAVAPAIEEKLLSDDAQRTVHQACVAVRQKTAQKFLRTKKLREEVFNAYFAAIEVHISDLVMGTDGHDSALFEALRKALPDITKADYKKNHRGTLEYLARLCRREALEELQKSK